MSAYGRRANMKSCQVSSALSEYLPVVPDEDDVFHIKITDMNDSSIVYYEYHSQDVLTKLINEYAEWSFVYNSIPGRYTQTEPYLYLFGLWTDFKFDNMQNWQRIAAAYNSEYNPIHNYDRTENENYDKSSGYTNTDSYDNYSVTSKPADSTVTHEIGNGSNGLTTTTQSTTYNDDTLVDKLKNTTQGTETTSTTYSNGNTTTYTGTHTLTNNSNEKLNNRNLRVSGNIGVTTTQQMINAEIDLRKVDMLEKILSDFAREHLVLLGDDEDEC